MATHMYIFRLERALFSSANIKGNSCFSLFGKICKSCKNCLFLEKLAEMDKENIKVEWSKEAIMELISSWQTYECLYNPKNKLYHNKHSRYAALNAIADNLKNKMQYLRGQYTRELSKSKEIKSGYGTDDIYVPNAYWFQELHFLQDFVKVRKGTCNIYGQNSESLDDSCESSQTLECDISIATPKKKIKVENQTPTNKEDAVLQAAVSVLAITLFPMITITLFPMIKMRLFVILSKLSWKQ
ncbi:uncharacterized protein isoform X2 [Musca autumnalis]|uniref:uncharacterized protein isoform X2 n=1 Tax=Musca autumnalis TaxID=221902 RepID=UPI003CEC4430